MQEAGATVQKGIGEGQQTYPHQHLQAQEEEGSEEVAAHMCLYITVLLCSIKNVNETRSICFYVDRLASCTL